MKKQKIRKEEIRNNKEERRKKKGREREIKDEMRKELTMRQRN